MFTPVRTIIVFILLLQLSSLQARPPLNGPKQISALVAVDTLTNLRTASTSDVKLLRETLEGIALATELKLNLTVLQNRQLNAKAISTWLSKLKPQSNDIVLFYFSGHGFRNDRTEGRWPNLYLPGQQQAIAGSLIVDKMNEIQPRLGILLYDCCNSNPVAAIKRPLHSKNIPVSNDPKFPGLFRLFKQTKGLIVASGSIPGQNSFGSDEGGIFTIVLLRKLWEESLQTDASWQRLLTSTKTMCSEIQIPQYELSLR